MKLLAGFVLVVLVYWVGSTLRDGNRYAYRTGANLLDADTQQYVWDVLAQGYLAADFNNALVILDCQPSMQLITTTMFHQIGSANYVSCPGWRSYFGTVNTLALWWFDLGWLSVPVSLAVGAWLGYAYVLALRTAPQLRYGTLFFLISYAGVSALVRINYFFLSFFVFPFLFLCVFWIMTNWKSSINERTIHQRVAVTARVSKEKSR